MISSARDEGIEEGIKAGIKAGKLEVARSMLLEGFSVEKINIFTGLSVEEIKAVMM